MSRELEQAYHDTAIDFATAGNREMYEFYMDKIIELTCIPEDVFNKDLDNISVDIEREEKVYLKFINKLRNNIF